MPDKKKDEPRRPHPEQPIAEPGRDPGRPGRPGDRPEEHRPGGPKPTQLPADEPPTAEPKRG